MSGTQISRPAQVRVYLGKHWRLFVNERGWKVLIFAAIISALVSAVLGGNMRGSADYRREICKVLVRRAAMALAKEG